MSRKRRVQVSPIPLGSVVYVHASLFYDIRVSNNANMNSCRKDRYCTLIIINLQVSNLPGSHFVSVLIKADKIYYFDSLAFPLLNSYVVTKLKTLKKPVYYCTKAIQGANSVFCGLYCICFLIICQRRNKSFEKFLKMFWYDSSDCYLRNEDVCTKIIMSSFLFNITAGIYIFQ